jgi:hypothetical protein
MTYLARFKDSIGVLHMRRYTAKHTTHAYRKATAIAASNKWKLESLGTV